MSGPPGADAPQDLRAYLGMYFAVSGKLQPSQTFISVLAGLIVWDYAITVPDEIRHVWLAGFSPLNAILFVLRYWLLSVAFSDTWFIFWPSGNVQACSKICRFLPYSSMITYLLGNIINTVRLYALWDRSKLVLGGMSILLLAQFLAQVIVPLNAVPVPMPPTLPGLPIPQLSACLPARIRFYWVFFAFPLIFDLVATALSAISLVKLWRQGSRTSIVKTLLKHSTLYFWMSLAASTTNMIWFSTSNGTNRNPALLAPMGPICSGIFAYRMVFSLRKAASGSSSSLQGSFPIGVSKASHRHVSEDLRDIPLSARPLAYTESPKQAEHSTSIQPVDLKLAQMRTRQDSDASRSMPSVRVHLEDTDDREEKKGDHR